MGSNKTPDEAMDNATLRLRTVGVEVALEAGIAIAGDPRAPAAARTAAMSNLFRAAGLFDRATRADVEQDLADMDGDQLRAHLAKLTRLRVKLTRGLRDEPDEGGAAPNAFD